MIDMQATEDAIRRAFPGAVRVRVETFDHGAQYGVAVEFPGGRRTAVRMLNPHHLPDTIKLLREWADEWDRHEPAASGSRQ